MEQQPGLIHRLIAAWRRWGVRYVLATTFLLLFLPIWRRRPSLVGREREFVFQGRSLAYLFRRYNMTWLNERCVEIPVALHMIERFQPGSVLEVGNVLAHYQHHDHDVVDKYEVAPGVVNADVADFSPSKQYDLIVSISTMEHVGWDERPREAGKAVRALIGLRKHVRKGGHVIVTVPLGYNADLDGALAKGEVPFLERYYLKRISANNRWVETDEASVQDCGWDAPFRGTNAVLVGVLDAAE